MIIVSNSSPLIILYKCNKLELLKQIFGNILIPNAVHFEVVINTKDPLQRDSISRCDFIQLYSAPIQHVVFSNKLDRGEAEAIELACTLQADYLLIDDKRAQKEDTLHNIDYIPTLALLLKGAQKGFISDFNSILNILQHKNIFLNHDLNNHIRKFLDSI